VISSPVQLQDFHFVVTNFIRKSNHWAAMSKYYSLHRLAWEFGY